MIRDCIEPDSARGGGRELELAALVGGDATAEEAARTEAHLAVCPACRAFTDGLRESQGGLAALADEPTDPEALARVRRAVRRRIEDEAARAERRPAWALALAAGLMLALLAAAVWLWGPGGGARGSWSEPSERVAETPDRAATEPEVAPTRPTGGPGVGGEEEADPLVSPTPEPRATAAPRPRPPEPPAPVRQAAADPTEPASPAATPKTEEPMVIQVVSDDPDIVFYWLVEPEETEDETVPS